MKKRFAYLFIFLVAVGIYSFATSREDLAMVPQEGFFVHVLDVGQGDSTLITSDGYTMLIDAGPTKEREKVLDYLDQQGVHRLDVLVATHPHEDHIGGMTNVVEQREIGMVLMPRVTTNTRTFLQLVEAITHKGLQATVPQVGSTFQLGKAKCTVLAPSEKEEEELNNYSIVLRVEYGENAFLFTGDAEQRSEEDMLKREYPLKSDFLKAGHHGANSSTSKNFLKEVDPAIVAISVGAGNSYGHPGDRLMKRLNQQDVKIFRTDLLGDLVFYSDGKEIQVLS